MTFPIMAWADRATNADLMVDCRDLGYITGSVIDLTYGKGVFWSAWKPFDLVACDLDPVKSPLGRPVDFTDTDMDSDSFDTVVFDPPFKLNGTPTEVVDDRYGVGGEYVGTEGRHRLMRDGLTEAARVVRPKGHVLVKCMDQVSSGKVHWQTHMMAAHATTVGLDLVDSLLFPSYRAQPIRDRQVHARRNYSTLLVFEKVQR